MIEHAGAKGADLFVLRVQHARVGKVVGSAAAGGIRDPEGEGNRYSAIALGERAGAAVSDLDQGCGQRAAGHCVGAGAAVDILACAADQQ